MSKRDLYKLSVLGVLLFSSFLSKGNWKLKATSDFNYYYTAETKQYLVTFDSVFKEELYNIQKRLNYHINQPIDVFVVDNVLDQKFLEGNGVLIEQLHKGGVVNTKSERVVIHVMSSLNQVKLIFRKSAVTTLLNEMMYGGALQDKIKSSNLIHLPDWVIPGLIHYLSDNWSADTDNKMRLIYDEYDLTKFNAIPKEFNQVKGAAFWKFLSHKYGKSAIPTILYMARLTRKFNAAVYFSFQVSVNSLFKDWQDYYSYAYSIDNKKPNPIDGVVLDINYLYDIYVEDEDHYYTLEKDFVGIRVYQNFISENKKVPIYRLGVNEQPLTKFSGSLQLIQGVPHLLTNSAKGIKLYKIGPKVEEQTLNVKWVNECKLIRDTLYLLQASTKNSIIYKVENNKVNPLYTLEHEVISFALSNKFLAFSVDLNNSSIINVVDQNNNLQSSLTLKNSSVKHLLFGQDSILLFNTNQNGIWNGQFWDVNNTSSEQVTNYRSNIAFHQYSNNVFVEYLDRGKFSSIFISDPLKIEDFYFYDTITPAFFKVNSKHKIAKDTSENTQKQDSLLAYTFQSPINPSIDFTLSNYDSLVKESQKKNKLENLDIESPNFYRPSSLTAQFTNVPLLDHQTMFPGGVSGLSPKFLNLKFSNIFSNQDASKSIRLGYQGLLNNGRHSLAIGYKGKKEQTFQVDVLHRQFKISDSRIFTNFLEVKRELKVLKPLSLSYKLGIRSDRQSFFAVDNETINLPNINMWLGYGTVALRYEQTFKKQWFQSKLALTPMYRIGEGQNLTTKFSFNYIFDPSNVVSIRCNIKLGNSLGSSPTYFVLGGVSNDILDKPVNRAFSGFKNPAIYQLEYGVRGFRSNYRNGTSYAMANLDVNISVFNLLFKRPIMSEVFSNLDLIPFVDVATSFYGPNIYNKANNLNSKVISSSTGVIVANVRAFKNPVIASVGSGLSTTIYNYKIRIDYAVGVEDGKLQSNMLHLGIGHKF